MAPGYVQPREHAAAAVPASRPPLTFQWPVSLVTLIFVVVFNGIAHSADRSLPPQPGSDPTIVIGFLGGFVHRNDLRHSEVQLAERLRTQYANRAYVEVFENHREEDAHRAILNWLDADGEGGLSNSEKRQARIILYGHSWGASAVVALARQLQQDGIPVLLTIQVDSIAKLGQDDHTIPPNVVRAVNFFQSGGPLHGRAEIIAADPTHTEILGDYHLHYTREPEACSTYPWFARHFFKGHTSIECDPNVWSQIEALIGKYLLSPGSQAPDIVTLGMNK